MTVPGVFFLNGYAFTRKVICVNCRNEMEQFITNFASNTTDSSSSENEEIAGYGSVLIN